MTANLHSEQSLVATDDEKRRAEVEQNSDRYSVSFVMGHSDSAYRKLHYF